MTRTWPAAQRGFSLVAAMFVMIIVALVIAAMSRLAINQHGTSSLLIQQARAYQAARAGLEWGIARAVAGNCAASFAVDLGGSSLAEFSGVLVACSQTSYVEDGQPVNIFTLSATANNGDPAIQSDYAYRRLTAVVEK
jgi:MSHA biogenesis protein MshP